MAQPECAPGERLWYIGLGSNVGDRETWLQDAAAAASSEISVTWLAGSREGYLREALRRLAETPGITVQTVSSLYETDPWGDTDQEPFLNAAARVLSPLARHALEQELAKYEQPLLGPQCHIYQPDQHGHLAERDRGAQRAERRRRFENMTEEERHRSSIPEAGSAPSGRLAYPV